MISPLFSLTLPPLCCSYFLKLFPTTASAPKQHSQLKKMSQLHSKVCLSIAWRKTGHGGKRSSKQKSEVLMMIGEALLLGHNSFLFSSFLARPCIPLPSRRWHPVTKDTLAPPSAKQRKTTIELWMLLGRLSLSQIKYKYRAV